jgi:hypothetical protein
MKFIHKFQLRALAFSWNYMNNMLNAQNMNNIHILWPIPQVRVWSYSLHKEKALAY